MSGPPVPAQPRLPPRANANASGSPQPGRLFPYRTPRGAVGSSTPWLTAAERGNPASAAWPEDVAACSQRPGACGRGSRTGETDVQIFTRRPVQARCSNGIGRIAASLVLATAFAGLSLAALPLVAASPALASTGSGFCSAYGGVSSSGVQFDNVYPCANPNISDGFGYQCVEYSVRFEAVVYGVAPSWAGGPGADVVNELRQHGVPASSPNGSSAGSSAGPNLPAPGDVISMWGPGQDPAGHTGVVVAVSVSNGTGSITYYDENGWQSNGVSRGYDVISVNPGGWSDNMGSSFDYTVFNWTLQATSTPTVAAALVPGSKAGYSLNGDGTLTPFGGAPAATQAGHQWPDWDIARSVAILPNGSGGYVLDGWGGIHPFAIGANPMPPATSGGPYWSGWDIARGLVLNQAGTGGYVLDGWGGLHPFAVGTTRCLRAPRVGRIGRAGILPARPP